MRNKCSQINTWFLYQFAHYFMSLVLMVNVMEWFYVSYNTCEEYKSKSGEQTIIMMSNTRELINVWQQRFHDGYWHCFFLFQMKLDLYAFQFSKKTIFAWMETLFPVNYNWNWNLFLWHTKETKMHLQFHLITLFNLNCNPLKVFPSSLL